MAFAWQQEVLFRHCDPAGIVFYPRYFEMLNDGVEALFSAIPSHGFAQMHPDYGVPTARIETTFTAPSRHGDLLDFTLGLSRVGNTSASTVFAAHCGGDLRLQAASVLVYVGPDLRPAPWPGPVRAALLHHLEGPQ